MTERECPHVGPDELACLECRLASIDWEKHPCRELIETTLKSLPPSESFVSEAIADGKWIRENIQRLFGSKSQSDDGGKNA